MKSKHVVWDDDLSIDEYNQLLEKTVDIKKNPRAYAKKLEGKTLGMIFEKSSTRTRVSFEVGTFQLGGHALFLSPRDMQMGRGETIADTARVLSRFCDGIMLRTFAHDNVRELAKWSRVPVINGLCDLVHPCQGLCDFFTISEKKGALKGKTLTYVGDGNNVAHSLIFGAAKTGMHIVLGVPAGYEPQARILEASEADRKKTGGTYKLVHDPVEAVKGADVIYTDVWVSMGQDEETAKRKRDLAPFQVNGALFGKAKPDAIFMHCLPAHRGDEVTDEVADHARSVIFDQAENRMHTQKTLMVELMGQ